MDTPHVAFLVEDMISGMVDGFYFDRKSGELALQHLRQVYPTGHWLLLQVAGKPDRTIMIPEHRFAGDDGRTRIDLGGGHTMWKPR